MLSLSTKNYEVHKYKKIKILSRYNSTEYDSNKLYADIRKIRQIINK